MDKLKKLKESLDSGENKVPDFINDINEITKRAEQKGRVVKNEREFIEQTPSNDNNSNDILLMIDKIKLEFSDPIEQIDAITKYIKGNDEYLEYKNKIDKESEVLAAMTEIINYVSDIDELIITMLTTIDENKDFLPLEFISTIKDRYLITKPLVAEDYTKFI